MTAAAISPAGWTLRRFTLGQLEDLLTACAPALVEVSKDFIRDAVSLKALGESLGRIRAAGGGRVAFAGTTDLVNCAGLSWERYRQYVAVQIAQARFLQASLLRLFLGPASPSVPLATVLERVCDIAEDAVPMDVGIEIHAGFESDPVVLAALVAETPVVFIVDFENMRRAGLDTGQLPSLLPPNRVAYFHQRNLGKIWVEHPASLDDERRWHALCPDTPFLWEPKTIDDPARIQELFREYRASD